MAGSASPLVSRLSPRRSSTGWASGIHKMPCRAWPAPGPDAALSAAHSALVQSRRACSSSACSNWARSNWARSNWACPGRPGSSGGVPPPASGQVCVSASAAASTACSKSDGGR